MKPTTIGLVVAAVLVVSTAIADEHDEGITLNYPDKLEWKDGPPSLPKGAKIAILEGDPSKEGPFVFRVKAPDGYRIPPHTHPKMERVTVISGTFNIGMGKTFDQQATKAMTAGTYGYWEPDIEHFVWIKGGDGGAVPRHRAVDHQVRRSQRRPAQTSEGWQVGERQSEAQSTKGFYESEQSSVGEGRLYPRRR